MLKIITWLKDQLAWVKQKFAWLSRAKFNGDDLDDHQSPEATNLSEQTTASDFTTAPSKEDHASLNQIYFNQPTEIIDEYETVSLDSLVDQSPEADSANWKLRQLRTHQGSSSTDDLRVSVTATTSTVAPMPVTLQEIPDVYDDLNQQTSENKSKLDQIDQKIKEFYPEQEDQLTKTTNDHYFVHETVKIPLGDGKDLAQCFQTQKLESINTQEIDLTLKSDETDNSNIIKKVG